MDLCVAFAQGWNASPKRAPPRTDGSAGFRRIQICPKDELRIFGMMAATSQHGGVPARPTGAPFTHSKVGAACVLA